MGGLKEKIMAAHRGELKTLIVPQDNEKDPKRHPRADPQDLQRHPRQDGGQRFAERSRERRGLAPLPRARGDRQRPQGRVRAPRLPALEPRAQRPEPGGPETRRLNKGPPPTPWGALGLFPAAPFFFPHARASAAKTKARPGRGYPRLPAFPRARAAVRVSRPAFSGPSDR
ncbi:MAG: hypothetical protein LBO66_00920 [Deltaproteobacteria bacterium]|nr:hypothetical protein [Deltaproteobacteria bacterium]